MNDCHKYCRMILCACFIAAFCVAVTVSAALVETPEGVVGYQDTAKQPWSGFYKHGPDRPAPRFVGTGTGDVSVAAPSDADVAKKDDAKKIVLFNGKNLDGWKVQSQTLLGDPSDVWTVHDGILKCIGVPLGYIRTVENYSNYKLHLEWRWAGKPTNSGVLLHIQGADIVWPLCIEAQMMDQNAGDFVVVQNATITVDDKKRKAWEVVPKKHPSSEKPTGQWNSYDIICDGNTIELTVNGVKQHYGTNCTPSSGHIGLESEGSPIEFRNIYLIPLKK